MAGTLNEDQLTVLRPSRTKLAKCLSEQKVFGTVFIEGNRTQDLSAASLLQEPYGV
jgi:hypothetical protein